MVIGSLASLKAWWERKEGKKRKEGRMEEGRKGKSEPGRKKEGGKSKVLCVLQ